MKTKHIVIIIGALFIVQLSTLVWQFRHDALHRFKVRVQNDSLFVDGAIYNSNAFGIPLSFQDTAAKLKYDGREAFQQTWLRNPRKVVLQFSEPIDSYSVHVTLHPDEFDDYVGMAEWVFSKGEQTICINTGFYMRGWPYGIADQTDGTIRYRGEAYSLKPFRDMVQGNETTIPDTWFCLKDVDFDGEKEFCFQVTGYNRYYYTVYKKVSETRAERMTGKPYENIVYSSSGACTTYFNYDNQTIRVIEKTGRYTENHLYRKRYMISDILDPMQHVSGENFGTCPWGDYKDVYEKGEWVKSLKTYPLDETSSATALVAEYVATGERAFTLQTLRRYDLRTNKYGKIVYRLSN